MQAEIKRGAIIEAQGAIKGFAQLEVVVELRLATADDILAAAEFVGACRGGMFEATVKEDGAVSTLNISVHRPLGSIVTGEKAHGRA